jgi:hypothetical protein
MWDPTSHIIIMDIYAVFNESPFIKLNIVKYERFKVLGSINLQSQNNWFC